jgi:hypothetical protein
MLSLKYSLSALRLNRYFYPFTDDLSNKTSLQTILQEYETENSETTLTKVKDSYVFGIKINDFHNTNKSKLVLKSQKFLNYAVLAISIAIIITVIHIMLIIFDP